MLIPLVQGFGKVIAFRLKRPKQKGRTLHNSTTTNHEGISSIPASVSNPVPALVLSSISSLVPPISAISQSALEASIDRSSARYSGGVSLAREASDMAQVALPLVQAIVGAIPLVGAPMQAAISGIMTSLQAIDVSARLMMTIYLDPKDYHRDAVRTSRALMPLHRDSIDCTSICAMLRQPEIPLNNAREMHLPSIHLVSACLNPSDIESYLGCCKTLQHEWRRCINVVSHRHPSRRTSLDALPTSIVTWQTIWLCFTLEGCLCALTVWLVVVPNAESTKST
jgi:hypothetical protein